MKLPSLELQPGRVMPVWAGHPWVFAQAVAQTRGNPQPGAEVLVMDAKGQVLGRALYSPGSAIVARLFTRDADSPIDAELFRARIGAAIARRGAAGLPNPDTNGYRVLHGEGDELPGLIVDRLGDVLSVQFGTIGTWLRRELVLDELERAFEPRAIVERSSVSIARKEGFQPGSGVVRGDASVEHFGFRELGFEYTVPLALGQKTGFYFDQRPLRARVEALAQGKRVLDLHCYVGAVSLSAARGGATSVVGVDTSAPALQVARAIALSNGLAAAIEFREADAERELERSLGACDLVVCDPPKLAPSRAASTRAQSVMRRLAAASCRALSPGGTLILCSCSAALGAPEVTRALALGARDAGRRALVVERLFQGPDHPVPAAFPEGLYLSSVVAEVL